MKIVICGSSSFKEKMIEYKKKLTQLGHEAIVHEHYERFVKGELKEIVDRVEKEHGAVKKEYGYMNWYFDQIKNSEGILVLNFDKNNIKNYIGANTFLELGYAHALGKKIFLVNESSGQPYIKDELGAMDLIVLNGDLDKIKNDPN